MSSASTSMFSSFSGAVNQQCFQVSRGVRFLFLRGRGAHQLLVHVTCQWCCGWLLVHSRHVMSTIAPLVVGLIASGASYAYVSRELVTSRNGLMLKHFNADREDLFFPVRKVCSSTAPVLCIVRSIRHIYALLLNETSTLLRQQLCIVRLM